jgi:hypothetical protein
MLINKIKYCLIIFLVSTVFVSAQDLSGVSGSFVDLGFGTKAAGMGKAFVGQADDANSVFWNPSGLLSSKKIKVDFNYLNQLQIVPFSSLAASIPIGKRNAVGVGFVYSGDAALKEFSLIAGYAHKFGRLSLGVNFKYRYASFGNNSFNSGDYIVFDPSEITAGNQNKIYGTGNGFGLDLGVKYRISKVLNVGLVLRDIFAPFSWNSQNDNPLKPARGSYSESMPFKSVIGISLRPSDEFIINSDYQPSILNDEFNIIRFGAEYTVFRLVSFRVGSEQIINSLKDEKYSFGLGFAYNIGSIKILANYAYVLEQLANTSRFSIGFNF